VPQKSGYRKAGRCLVIGVREIVDAHPWIPASLIRAFEAAQSIAFKAMRTEAAVVSSPWMDEVIEDQRAALGTQLYANGLARNRTQVERLLRYLREQGLVSCELTPEDVFAQEP
jgi:4,5-dihydroxyphthalate decarboxylase